MADEDEKASEQANDATQSRSSRSLSVGPAVLILVLVAVIVVLLGLLAVSIMERRWEAQRPQLAVKPIAEWESDNAKWGDNYQLEYESYLKTEDSKTRTKYGGAFPRDYLDADPRQVILFAGYGFSKDYLQARGHYHAVTDILKTQRIQSPVNAATCWTCKSPDVPRLMNKMGVKEFYAANFHDLKPEVANPIGCLDCHDPKTMKLRLSRPALREGLAAGGKAPEPTYQEMRSLVCAQCHSEYYFKTDAAAGLKNYLTFPWANGTSVEGMIAYYDALNFADFTHPISKTRIIKCQHPDYEMYRTGIHAYRGVACSDCHMPYRTAGGVKFTDHHVRSPLLNIASSCGVCHRWSEEEIRTRVEGIQTKVLNARGTAEDALVRAHFDVAAAIQVGAGEAELAGARKLLRHAQFRWDYVAANNGLGFHSPQESMRILGDAIDQAQRARLLTARILARKGVTAEPKYPDISTREKAWAVAQAFIVGKGPNLLP